MYYSVTDSVCVCVCVCVFMCLGVYVCVCVAFTQQIIHHNAVQIDIT